MPIWLRWCIVLCLLIPATGLAQSKAKARQTAPKAPPAAPAPPTGPVIEAARLGFSSVVRPDCWMPAEVVLKNYGLAADVEVLVFAEEGSGTRQPLVTRAAIHLPEHAVWRHALTCHVTRNVRLVFELHHNGRRVGRKEVDPFLAGAREVLALGYTAGANGFGCPQQPDGLEASPRLRFYHAGTVEELPTRWEGLESVALVVLGALPPGGMPTPQEDALVDWVRAGGLLVLSPGDVPAHYDGTRIATLSPVRLLGTRTVAALPALKPLYGALPAKGERIGLAEAALVDGETLAQMNDQPLIAVRREGLGMVAFVGFDLSHDRLTGWPNTAALYFDLLHRAGALPRPSATEAPEAVSGMLSEAVGVRVLPRWALGIFLGLYIGGAAVALVLLRNRREWAFAGLLAGAPLVALLINGIGAAASGVDETALASVHVLRTATGESRGMGAGYYALLSPREATCAITFPSTPTAFPRAPILAEGASRGTAAAQAVRESLELVEGDTHSLQNVRVRPRALADFSASYTVTASGALRVEGRLTAQGLRVQVSNQSARPLTDAFVACNRSVELLGDVAAGRTVSAILGARSAHGPLGGFSRGGLRSKIEIERDSFIAALFAPTLPNQVPNTGLIAGGWIDGAPVVVEVTGLADRPTPRERTLWIARGEIPRAEGRIVLPKGALEMRLLNVKGTLVSGGRWAVGPLRPSVEAEFLLPAAARGLRVERLRLYAAVSGTTTPFAVEAWNFETGRYETISPAGASARTGVAAAEPARYCDPASGAVRLRLKFAMADSLSMSQAPRTFSVTDLDLDIEGTLE